MSGRKIAVIKKGKCFIDYEYLEYMTEDQRNRQEYNLLAEETNMLKNKSNPQQLRYTTQHPSYSLLNSLNI